MLLPTGLITKVSTTTTQSRGSCGEVHAAGKVTQMSQGNHKKPLISLFSSAPFLLISSVRFLLTKPMAKEILNYKATADLWITESM